MSNCKIRAMFFDIDGTLVPFGETSPTTATVEALKGAHERGIKIFIATGRPKIICTSVKVLDEAGVVDGYVTMNGAYCLAGEQVVRKVPFTREYLLRILDFCKRHRCAVPFVGPECHVVCFPNGLFQEIWYDTLRVSPEAQVVEPAEALRLEIFQVSPFFSRDEEQAFLQETGPLNHVRLCRWHPSFVDICMTDKSEGMDAICQHFGIDLSETAAFGDGGNDVQMLQHAAIGIAMGQASEDVKSQADWVAPSCNDEGVAWAVHRLLNS